MAKRKQIIVNPKIQFKLIALVVFSALLPIVVLFIAFMMYSANLLAQIPVENEELIHIVESIQYLNFMTFGGFIAIVLILAVLEIFFLHKIVGPIFRIETDIETILSSNDCSKRVSIRKNDYVHSLVQKINALLDKFQKGN
ncbi:hypothetical protein ACFL3D_00130 [Candidatus Omnitrophota bacterium]